MSDNKININSKKDRTNIAERDDLLSNRIMTLLITVTALIVTLLLLKKNNNHFEAEFIIYALPFVRLGAGLVFIASLAYYIVRKRQKIDDSMKFFGSPILLASASLLFGISLMFTYLLVTGTVICLIAAILLYFIFCFYQRDFFWFSVITAAGTVLLYAASLDPTTVMLKNIVKTASKVSAVILPAIFIIAILVFKRADGCMMLRGRKVKIMKDEYRYYPFITAAAITLAGSVAARLFLGTMIYSIVLLLAAYLLIAIIYTVKMI
ncbi:MAG: hypothetical protein ACYCWE_09425 [Eubacteriales bacterium]